MSDAVYAGQGKVKEFKWGKIMSLLLFREDVETLLANLNDSGCVTLDIKEKKEPSAKGYTHYGQLFIQSERTSKQPTQENEAEDDNLPF